MTDVAAAAGVSPMTVSNTYKYPERVQEQTRARVLECAAELGYVPNIAAGNLAAGESRVIGGTIPSMRNSSFYKYVLGMQNCANAHGYKLVLMLADTIEQERSAIEALIGLRVAGLVLVGTEHAPEAMTLLKRSGIPVVESWTPAGAMDLGVGFDTAAATRTLVRLLLKDERRQRIALIVHEGTGSRRFLERVPAFRAELAAAGRKDDLVHFAQETDGFGAGRRALDALLQREPELDAVICPTDIVAAGILFECSRRGLAVPDQLAVAGWGDYELAQEVTPQLTTVHPNASEMGAAAIDLLIRRGQGTIPAGYSIDTGFEILERASTRERAHRSP
ncbi:MULTISPECIES: LacI family DNA-binding transcriptional regulator [unclassified Xanthobacter]|uniref:LacI family DNA-binding transcriptional regulator n=1 Tax=unclassified Xanthobacter TaxID=2623496 RepID=UPI001EE108E2|nr:MULTISPECIES: LacI family DNA-binding transcriptional regulator [unclassified Xanthobacter]